MSDWKTKRKRYHHTLAALGLAIAVIGTVIYRYRVALELRDWEVFQCMLGTSTATLLGLGHVWLAWKLDEPKETS